MYLDFSLLFVLISCLKEKLIFHCLTLYDCDAVDTMTSNSEMNVLIYWVEYQFFFHLEISLFQGHLYNNKI